MYDKSDQGESFYWCPDNLQRIHSFKASAVPLLTNNLSLVVLHWDAPTPILTPL